MISEQDTKSKQKIGLIRVQDQSAWISCQSINDNLEQAYRSSACSRSYFLYSDIPTVRIIDEIIRDQCSVIVFSDHRVRLLELLRSILFINYIKENKVKIIIHTFGCFMDRLSEYHEAGKILKGQEVIFLGASPRHTELIKKFIPEASVEHLPFGVDTHFFRFDSTSREEMRAELKLSPQTPLFLYTGRISCQKNIELIMRSLHQLRDSIDFKFLTLGDFDHYEPYQGVGFLGGMEQTYTRVLNEIDPKREWCWHHPFVNHTFLKKYLSAADAYISLSTYRSDDFAMSVAEAKCVGLPSFLTDWAGHSGYKNLPYSYFAGTHLDSNDLTIDMTILNEEIKKFKILKDEQRLNIADAAVNRFKIETVSIGITHILAKKYPPFQGLNSKNVFLRNTTKTTGIDLMTKMKDFYEAYSR